MKDRVQEFLRYENKTSSQFAVEIGVQPSSVSHIISGRNKPSLDFVLKMLNAYPDISTDWLLFGRGSMLIKAASEQDSSLDSLFGEETIDINTPQVKAVTQIIDKSEPVELVTEASKGLSKVILLHSDGTFTEYHS